MKYATTRRDFARHCAVIAAAALLTRREDASAADLPQLELDRVDAAIQRNAPARRGVRRHRIDRDVGTNTGHPARRRAPIRLAR